jgi:hypothetical protein
MKTLNMKMSNKTKNKILLITGLSICGIFAVLFLIQESDLLTKSLNLFAATISAINFHKMFS